MTYEELKKLIDSAMSQLQAASDEIEGAMGTIGCIDGETVTFDDADDALDFENLGESLGDAMTDMENASDDIANAIDALSVLV